MESNLSGTSGSGGQVKEQARQQGQQLAQQARQQASDLANRGGEQVKSQLENQKHNASQRMVPIQTALRETAQQLRRQGQGPVAGYADQASDQVERFSGYLRETSVEEITDEVRGFARRRPALFVGGAVALGFLGTRFLKSSSQQAPSGDQGLDATGGATSSGVITQGTGEPATALPPGRVVDSPRVRPTPLTGETSSQGDYPQAPRGI